MQINEKGLAREQMQLEMLMEKNMIISAQAKEIQILKEQLKAAQEKEACENGSD